MKFPNRFSEKIFTIRATNQRFVCEMRWEAKKKPMPQRQGGRSAKVVVDVVDGGLQDKTKTGHTTTTPKKCEIMKFKTHGMDSWMLGCQGVCVRVSVCLDCFPLPPKCLTSNVNELSFSFGLKCGWCFGVVAAVCLFYWLVILCSQHMHQTYPSNRTTIQPTIWDKHLMFALSDLPGD